MRSIEGALMVRISKRETDSRTCWSKTSELWSTFDQPIKEDEARQRSEQQGRTIIHHKIELLFYRAAQVIVANRIMEIGDMGI